MKNIYFLLHCVLLHFMVSGQDVAPPIFNKATWIAADTAAGNSGTAVFFKSLNIGKKIQQVTLYITAHGIYEATINGKKVGKGYFTPGYTYYTKRLQYQEYDITALLASQNDLRISVAPGWWRWSRVTVPNLHTMVLCAIVILYHDATRDTVYSDQSWQWTTGKIVYADIYNGQVTDFTQKENWRPVTVQQEAKNILVPTTGTPVIKHEIIKPSQIIGDSVIDFGQNMAGWVKLLVKGKKGDSIIIRHAEVLLSNGSLYARPLRTAKATDIYILKGDGDELLEPLFTYHGFRYVQIIWIRGNTILSRPQLKDLNIRAVVLHTDLLENGTFSCSDPQLNQLHHNIRWSMKGNFFDIPTDCPQRDERLGWTLDADVFCATASFLMEVKDFYRKWLTDLKANQLDNGSVPIVVPGNPKEGGVPGWGDAATFTPWTLFQRYNDTGILKDQYSSMKAWVDYWQSISVNDLPQQGGFGDWYPAGPSTPDSYLDQCYWYRSTWILVQTATILQQEKDIDYYSRMLARIKEAFDRTYLDHIPPTQTAYVLGLHFGLLPKEKITELVNLIHQNNDHLATGFMGTPYLLPVLSDYGEEALAMKLLKQQDYPSWMYMINKGATTMWEKWDGIDFIGTPLMQGDISYNHYAFGSIGSWIYENILGIKPVLPGYEKTLIQPLTGYGITWAKGSYQTARGKIEVHWKTVGKAFMIQVTIPTGTTAKIIMPDHTEHEVGPGHYQF